MRRYSANSRRQAAATITLAALVLTAAVVACGSEPLAPNTGDSSAGAAGATDTSSWGGGGASAEPIAPVDCDTFAELTCESLAACSSFSLATQFGSSKQCAVRLTQLCTEAAAVGEALDASACLEQVMRDGCEAFRGGRLPSSCSAPLGSGKSGAACADDTGCASGFHCERKGGCGECQAWLALDAACASIGDCAPGLVCVDGACALPVEAGESCSGAVCGLHAECREGTCVALGQAGQACDASKGCDGASGFACRDGKCDVVELLEPGSACHADGASICAGASTCPATKLEPDSLCATLPVFGEQCTGVCAPPFACVEGACGLSRVVACRP